MPCRKYKGKQRKACYATKGWKIKVKPHRRKGKKIKGHKRTIRVKKKSLPDMWANSFYLENELPRDRFFANVKKRKWYEVDEEDLQ